MIFTLLQANNNIVITMVEYLVEDFVTEEVAIDDELVLSTSRSPPSSIILLRTVSVSYHCDAICHYKGKTYVGLFNHEIDRIDPNYNLTPSFLTLNSLVFSICVHQDRVYSLLFGKPYIVNVHDLHSGELLTSWNHCDDSYSYNKLAIVNNKVIIPDRLNKMLSVYELTGEPLREVSCPTLGSGYISLCKADSDSVIVSDSVTSRLFRIDLTTGKEIWSCTKLKVIPHAVTCDEYQYVYVTGHKSGKVWILDIRTGW